MAANFRLSRPARTNWPLRHAQLVHDRQVAKVDLLAAQLRSEAEEAQRRLGCN